MVIGLSTLVAGIRHQDAGLWYRFHAINESRFIGDNRAQVGERQGSGLGGWDWTARC
jgi:hypothetical protein